MSAPSSSPLPDHANMTAECPPAAGHGDFGCAAPRSGTIRPFAKPFHFIVKMTKPVHPLFTHDLAAAIGMTHCGSLVALGTSNNGGGRAQAGRGLGSSFALGAGARRGARDGLQRPLQRSGYGATASVIHDAHGDRSAFLMRNCCSTGISLAPVPIWCSPAMTATISSITGYFAAKSIPLWLRRTARIFRGDLVDLLAGSPTPDNTRRRADLAARSHRQGREGRRQRHR